MNPIVQELRCMMHNATTPSWANRAADEIERLERERAELLAALDQIATGRITGEPNNYAATLGIVRKIATDAAAKARGQV